MKYILILLILICGCSTVSPLSGLFTAKVSDKVQVAEKVTGIENAKIADKVADKLVDKVALVDTSKINTTSVGGNQTNDSEVIKEYILALKENANDQGKLYQKVIMGLIAQIGVLISLLGWCLKFLLKADERRDVSDRRKGGTK